MHGNVSHSCLLSFPALPILIATMKTTHSFAHFPNAGGGGGSRKKGKERGGRELRSLSVLCVQSLLLLLPSSDNACGNECARGGRGWKWGIPFTRVRRTRRKEPRSFRAAAAATRLRHTCRTRVAVVASSGKTSFILEGGREGRRAIIGPIFSQAQSASSLWSPRFSSLEIPPRLRLIFQEDGVGSREGEGGK